MSTTPCLQCGTTTPPGSWYCSDTCKRVAYHAQSAAPAAPAEAAPAAPAEAVPAAPADRCSLCGRTASPGSWCDAIDCPQEALHALPSGEREGLAPVPRCLQCAAPVGARSLYCSASCRQSAYRARYVSTAPALATAEQALAAEAAYAAPAPASTLTPIPALAPAYAAPAAPALLSAEEAHRMAAEALEIADKALPREIALAKLRIETRKWFLSKRAPEHYGDKVQHDVRFAVDLRAALEAADTRARRMLDESIVSEQ